MAMGQRFSGISNTTAGRPRQSYRPTYEDFQPQFELKEVPEAHIINVRLPGFLKEQVRITFVHSPGEIRVHGQRPLGNNKLSRFNKTFPLLQNSEPSKIHGKFHDGVLTITMPKKVITQVASPKAEEAAKPAADAQRPQKDSHHDEKVSSKEKDHTPAALEPKVQKGQDAIHQTAIATAAARYDKQGDTVSVPSKEQKGIPETKDTAGTQEQNDKEGSPPKVVSTMIPHETQRDNKRVIPLSSSSPQNTAVEPKSQKGTHGILPKVTELANENLGEAKNAVDGTPLHNREEIIHGKRLSTKEDVVEKLAPNTLDEVKKKRKQSGSGIEQDMRPKEDGTNAGKKEMASVIKWINDEEKQLLINMGAALLVLVAFGAYTSYNFWCSVKSKN